MNNRQSYLEHLNEINNQTYRGKDERGSYRASGNYKEVIPRGYSKTLKKGWTKQRDTEGRMYYVSPSYKSTYNAKEAYLKINKTSSADDAGRRQLENARDLEAKARAKQQNEREKTLKKIKDEGDRRLQKAKTELKNKNILDWDVYITEPKDGSKLYWFQKSTGESQWNNPVQDILNERDKKAKEKEKARIEAEKKKRTKINKQLAEQERERRRAEINAISKASARDLYKFEPKNPRQIPRPKTPVTRIGFGSKDSNDELSKSHNRNRIRANEQVFKKNNLTNSQRIDLQNSKRRKEQVNQMNENPHHHVVEFIQKAISPSPAPPTTGLSPYQKNRFANQILRNGNHDTAKSIYNIIPTKVFEDHESLYRELGNKEILDNSIKKKLVNKLDSYRKSNNTVTDRKGHRHIIHVPYYKNKNWMSWVTEQKILAKNKINEITGKTDDKKYALNRLQNFFHYYFTVFPEYHQINLEKSRNEQQRRQRPARTKTVKNPIPKGKLNVPIPPPETNLKKAVAAANAASKWRKRRQHKYLMYKTATFTLTKKEPYNEDKYTLKIVGVDGEQELKGQAIPDHILQGKWKEVDATNFANLYRTEQIPLQRPDKLKKNFKDNINFYKHLTSNHCFERDKIFEDGKEIKDPVQIRKKLNLPSNTGSVFPALREGTFTTNYWISQNSKKNSVWSQNLNNHTNEIRFTPAPKGHGGQQWKGEKTKDNPKGKAHIDTNKGIDLKNGWIMFELQNDIHDKKTKDANAVMERKAMPILFFIEEDYVTIPPKDYRDDDWASKRRILCEYEYRKIWVDKWSKNTANEDFIRRIVDFNTTYNYCSSDNSKYKSITSICTSNPDLVLEKWKNETKEKINIIIRDGKANYLDSKADMNEYKQEIINIFNDKLFKTLQWETEKKKLEGFDNYNDVKNLCDNLIDDISIGNFLENTINIPNMESPVEEIKEIHESNKTSINAEIVQFIDHCVEDLEKLNFDCKTGDDCINKINTNIKLLKNFKSMKQNEFQKIISQYDDWIMHYKSFMNQDNELDIELKKDIEELERRKQNKTSEFKKQIESEALKKTLTELITKNLDNLIQNRVTQTENLELELAEEKSTQEHLDSIGEKKKEVEQYIEELKVKEKLWNQEKESINKIINEINTIDDNIKFEEQLKANKRPSPLPTNYYECYIICPAENSRASRNATESSHNGYN